MRQVDSRRAMLLTGLLAVAVLGSVPAGADTGFAALSLVGESMRDPGLYFRNNIGGILSLLDACVQCGCRKILLSSSAATYGDPETVPIREDAPTRPTNLLLSTDPTAPNPWTEYPVQRVTRSQGMGWAKRRASPAVSTSTPRAGKGREKYTARTG